MRAQLAGFRTAARSGNVKSAGLSQKGRSIVWRQFNCLIGEVLFLEPGSRSLEYES